MSVRTGRKGIDSANVNVLAHTCVPPLPSNKQPADWSRSLLRLARSVARRSEISGLMRCRLLGG
jgi:hypothetical protein